MTLQAEKQLESAYVMPTFGRSDVEFVSGEGMRLKDADGKDYLDFLSGIGVCSLGHCHPAVVGAITEQAQKLIHVSNYFYIENRGEVAQKLSELLGRGADEGNEGASEPARGATPTHAQSRDAAEEDDDAHPRAWKTFFANSGAEANECAIKLARIWAQGQVAQRDCEPEASPSLIVTLVKSFHGRTLATLAATGQSRFHKGFEPIPEGFVPTPINDLASLESLFERLGSSICAVMIEVVQGESGVHVCAPDFVRGVRKLCDDHGALMICDEVQCGVFRTGRPFAYQHYGVVPDIVTTAKGIASGMPAAACSAKPHIADAMGAGKHGSTFGGSNLAMAAVRATLEALDQPHVARRIDEVGEYLRSQLASVSGVHSVRGLGLMVAADLDEGLDAHEVVAHALAEGLVINATGPSTLRFLPPLICTQADVDECVAKLKRAVSR